LTSITEAHNLNIIFSAAVLLLGLTVYWFFPPGAFETHPFTKRGYEFWLSKWMAFLLMWGLFKSSADPKWPLAISDINSMLNLGLALAFWQGDQYHERRVLTNLGFVFGLFFSWNFVVGIWADQATAPVHLQMLWLAPSMTLSCFSLMLMALVLLHRYRSPAAVVFCITTLAYIVLQMPAYKLTMTRISRPPLPQPANEGLLWLAFAKVIYGFSFYAFDRVVAVDYGSLHLPGFHWPSSPKLGRALTFILAAIISGIIAKLGEYVGTYLLHRYLHT
jgi:hypothetical protein